MHYDDNENQITLKPAQEIESEWRAACDEARRLDEALDAAQDNVKRVEQAAREDVSRRAVVPEGLPAVGQRLRGYRTPLVGGRVYEVVEVEIETHRPNGYEIDYNTQPPTRTWSGMVTAEPRIEVVSVRADGKHGTSYARLSMRQFKLCKLIPAQE